MIGMDTPQVSPELLEDAIEKLNQPGTGAVIGLCPSNHHQVERGKASEPLEVEQPCCGEDQLPEQGFRWQELPGHQSQGNGKDRWQEMAAKVSFPAHIKAGKSARVTIKVPRSAKRKLRGSRKSGVLILGIKVVSGSGGRLNSQSIRHGLRR